MSILSKTKQKKKREREKMVEYPIERNALERDEYLFKNKQNKKRREKG
jgi:hypothetical protein